MAQLELTDIFFDLDHTLWDFEKNSEITFNLIFEKHSINIDLNSFMNVYRPVNFKYWNMYRRNQIDSENLRFYRLKEVFETLKIKSDKQLINLIAEEYINYLSDQIHLFPDAQLTLNYLANKYRLHIITNGFEKIQHKKIKSSKIDHFFETVTTAEGSGFKKPDQRIFEHALKKAKTHQHNSLMIGDSLEADIQGAKDFGMEAIYFGKKPNFEIDYVENLKDLKTVL
ncbi:YjjG family noncanonical pyrimidine nucleotidase [Mesohalobacter halotolerans]|uniref:Noncanonical pyrimidine nucleotidase, YjjG family n=1 Tax=Mesohalobacter halotolerans TaxID=1883405 RepID=A0A4U5TTZ8_9FLAO|nr:YjjG family noncanonical pyrimidine nucleotidase [Mesohalobacter halotolerans]MBS3739531.1 YjjG family noncanonical pyrimidine nucleotidase [Psychroflexus sp.]TKS57633.1 noncanonical pyrimidine nucleotidase, YjjG family [Mesohalobacter halotolerans]